MNCPTCGTDNREGSKFCNECGSPLPLYCHACQMENRPGSNFCNECGVSLAAPTSAPTSSTPATSEPISVSAAEPEREPLSYTPSHLAEKILQSKSALEGERKQVTVLFCDLTNSTPIAEKIGPEHMHALLNRFFEIALIEVHRYEGTINQFLGDGFMAIMGAPIAHEDHARRAVLAALGLQRSLKDSELGEPYGVDCQFRIGVNSGLVVVGSIGDNLRMDYSAIGDTTNLAARLQTQAEPGEILVSETTARLVEGYIRLESLEPVEVKGKMEPVSRLKVLGTLPRRSPIVSRSERTLSQFVGRKRELATLEALFAQAESGQGQVVGIVAEAGQGKSRLLYEFRQRLQDKSVTYLEGRCLSYGSASPYHPIIDIVRHNCGITETDSPEAIIEKVDVALQEVGIEPEETAPYVLRLLGVQEGTDSIAQLTPEAVRSHTFETLRQMSLNGAQHRPFSFEIEDLHWIDKTSEDYIASLVENMSDTPILLLMTYRPGYRPPWIEKSYSTQISLHRLIEQEALSIVQSATQGQTLPGHLAQTIIEKSDGNPFFLEELTRAVIEQGEFQSDSMIPETVQGVLSARIDRLPEVHKRVLQTASVLGREFSLQLLEQVWDGNESTGPLLDDLKRQEFLFERTGTEESTYAFRHALTENVAYDSLLTTRREEIHTAAGRALEALYADRLEDAYDRLAYHYARTGHADKAVKYLTVVASKAAGGYANAEAFVIFQEALDHAERLPSEDRDHCVLDLAIQQSQSLHVVGRRREAVERLLNYQQCLERLQDPLVTGQYYGRLGWLYSFLGERDNATRCQEIGLEAARKSRDVSTLGRVLSQIVLEETFSGEFRRAVAHGREAVTLLEPAGLDVQLALAYYLSGWSTYFLGDFAQTLTAVAQAETLATKIGHRSMYANAVVLGGWTLAAQGEWKAGVAECQRALRSSPQAFVSAAILGMLGYALLEQGNLTEALPVLEQAVEQATQYRSQQIQSWYWTYLGEAYHLVGDIEKAGQHVHKGYQLAQDAHNPWGEALAQRALGRIAHTSDNLSVAGDYFHEALSIFETIQSRYELARTHLDLASLAHTQGSHDTATTYLNTAYAWFKKLQVPTWAERTEQLALEYGVMLTEVELEEFETEGSS